MVCCLCTPTSSDCSSYSAGRSESASAALDKSGPDKSDAKNGSISGFSGFLRYLKWILGVELAFTVLWNFWKFVNINFFCVNIG